MILAMAAAIMPVKTKAVVNQAMADSIVKNLSRGTSADTIRQLYDAFDLTPYKNRGEIGWDILNVARRTRNYGVMTDMLLQLSSIYMSDSITLNKLFTVLDELPDNDKKKSVRLFMRVEEVTGEATYLPVNERNQKLRAYLKEDMHTKEDIYEDVFDLYSVVLYLGKESKGNMYYEYIDRLEKMIRELPENYYIKNMFYTSAAIFYTQNNNPEKAVECDRQLLKQIEKLEEMYAEQGRKYRNYDRFKYICYRRMLHNYEALSMDEVKDLYARCGRLAEKDEEVASAFNENGRVKAYRMLADHNYAGAIPYLKQAVKSDKDKITRRVLLGFLVTAADSVGDKPTLLSALQEYNKYLVEEQKEKSQEALREMQIRYDVNALEKENDRLEIEKRDMEIATKEKLMSVAMVSLFVLAIVLMFLCRGYFRLKGDKRMLKEENAKLKTSLENYLRDGMPAHTKDIHNISVRKPKE